MIETAKKHTSIVSRFIHETTWSIDLWHGSCQIASQSIPSWVTFAISCDRLNVTGAFNTDDTISIVLRHDGLLIIFTLLMEVDVRSRTSFIRRVSSFDITTRQQLFCFSFVPCAILHCSVKRRRALQRCNPSRD